MIARFGIDTSILVRLLTGDPAEGFQRATLRLRKLVENEEAEIVVSNQVIGEAYIALQHHYKISKTDAREALRSVLRSGLISPQNGAPVFRALDASGGCGLVDRLIVDDYQRHELETLTLDDRMARLPAARKL